YITARGDSLGPCTRVLMGASWSQRSGLRSNRAGIAPEATSWLQVRCRGTEAPPDAASRALRRQARDKTAAPAARAAEVVAPAPLAPTVEGVGAEQAQINQRREVAARAEELGGGLLGETLAGLQKRYSDPARGRAETTIRQ